MKTVVLADGRIIRMSDVEAGRYERHRQRTEGLEDRFEPRHPNRSLNSRTAMRNMIRFRNKKRTNRYGG